MNDPWRAVTLGLCLLPIQAGVVGAADLPRPDEAMDYLAPAVIADAHPQWTALHRREALVLGDVLLWPSVTVGTVFDSNPLHQSGPHQAAAGMRFTPSVLAEREDGAHRTLAYAALDARVFPRVGRADTTDGRVGLLHDWAIRRDLTVRAQAEIARHTDPFNTVQLVAASAQRGLLDQTTILGTASVQKAFDRVFTVLAGSGLRSSFTADAGASLAGHRATSDETVTTLRARAGAWFTPTLYAFAEPSGDWHKLDALSRGSSGTRAVAGIGTTRIGLLSGEIFAGAQEQSYPVPRRTLAGPVVGGRLSWAPTRAWTVTVAFDQSLGDVAVATAADPLGTPTRQNTALVSVGYALTPLWSARAAVATIWIDDVGTPRRDTLTVADLRVDGAVSRSFDVTGALRFTALSSTLAPAAYQRAEATLGATYHY